MITSWNHDYTLPPEKMSERKAINKYYPPEYDPSQVPKKQKTARQDIKIRMMAPYSMRCLKCNEYIAQRRSFNARKEVTKEMYLSTKIVRFHITCPRCNNKISFKTNPQTAGYTPEEGAVRNYEPTRQTAKPAPAQETEDELLLRLEREELENLSFQKQQEQRKKNPFWQKIESLKDGDVMENLQARLEQQQRQQAITDHLEELQYKNSQLQANGGSDKASTEAREKIRSQIDRLQNVQRDLQDREDDQRAKEAFSLEKERKRTENLPQTKNLVVKENVTAKALDVVDSHPKRIPITLKRKREGSNGVKGTEGNKLTNTTSTPKDLTRNLAGHSLSKDYAQMSSTTPQATGLAGALGGYSSSEE